MSFAGKVIDGDVRSVARLIRDIEDDMAEAREALKDLYGYTGNAHIIGITGAPGTGKSTLVEKLVEGFRGEGKTVGVIAVDPTSPFTGGAILGDRVRMQSHSTDKGVFIRSVATRGHLGGISRSTNDIINVLDAAGKDVIIVETVGVGQDEVEIVRMAHTTIVVLIPGMGDDIQAIKAGILEIGDIFVVNKADRDGAEKTVREIKDMLQSNRRQPGEWGPLVLQTQAVRGVGVPDLKSEINRHRSFLLEEGHIEPILEDRARQKLLDEIKDMVVGRILDRVEKRKDYQKVVQDLVLKVDNPYSQAERMVDEIIK